MSNNQTTTEKTFIRAHELVADAELRQMSAAETVQESILRLCYRIAELEGAENKDEYSQD